MLYTKLASDINEVDVIVAGGMCYGPPLSLKVATFLPSPASIADIIPP